MRKEYFEFIGENKNVLPATIWLPEDEPRMVLQIVHGMTEHIGRYEKLAESLTAEGIAVAGFDLRGHGKTAADTTCASLGEDGWDSTIKEIHQFHNLLKKRFSAVKHCLLGFSLGSFLTREYFSIYQDADFEGAIIMGTGQQPAFLLSVIMMIVKGEIKKAGFDNTTDLVRNISFGTYNKKFSPNRTRADWLCSDETELDEYIADKLCKEDISAGLFWQLLGSMKRMADRNTYIKWNKDMPVLLISGANDPVGDAGKGVKLVESSMKKSGLRKVELELYTGGRHDILHEEKLGIADNVCGRIKSWMLNL
jgi:alpha-beta hydrolase superfamily lysophospholipase